MGAVSHHRLFWFFRRGLAASCAALILTLGLFAASPVLHQRLHHDADSTNSDRCAIVLFMSGISMPSAVSAPPPPVGDWREHQPACPAKLYLGSPRYLLRPERGPPVA